MQDDQFKELLNKYTEGKCSAEEIAWLESGYLKWNEHEKPALSEQQITDGTKLIWQHVAQHTQPAVTRSLWPRIAIAASVFVVLGIGLLFYNKAPKQVSAQNAISYTTVAGQKKRIVLPDGSKITLNGASMITLSADFNKKDRRINLIGEAYFEVVHDAGKPFTVHTKSVDIKDIGTIFNVKAYTGDQYTETSLIEGAIELALLNKKGHSVLLAPKQKAIVRNLEPASANVKVAAKSASTEPLKIISTTTNPIAKTIVETDWVNNRLTFNDESFEDIAVRMERWYNIKISFENQPVKNYRFVATFANENIIQVLEVLKQSRDFNYRKEGDVIKIY